ncbi:MAG: hypothetical protein J6Y07_00940 [Alphaproteobacteria bacterium]|nr:hypothetical protein [Alphaproteobacteria bacterium]
MFKLLQFLIIGILLSACSATVESRLDSVRGTYMTATETQLDNNGNLGLLINADKKFHNGDIAGSDALYEEFNQKNKDVTSGDIWREAANFAFGANANDYRPFMMDTLFVSYYQLWAAIAEGRWNDARVIINQSYARQQDMSIEYKKLIESTKDELAQHTEIRDKIDQWVAYRDIMNPALMYLSGIYFLTAGDFSDATTYLSRTHGMVPGNKFVADDLDLARTKQRPQNTVWVFIEDGFAPKLTEQRASLPIFIEGGLSWVTIATSQPILLGGTSKIDGAQEIANVDAMFMTEYNEYHTNEVLRAVASAAGRATLTATMFNSNSDAAPILGLLSLIYSESTTNAEVRTWATLPKTISVLRVTNNGLIELRSHGNVIANIKVPGSGNHLVYVRLADSRQDIKVMKTK